VTFLARLAKLGMVKEAVPYTYQVPAWSIPWNNGTKYTDLIAPLRDESVRANDSVVQGLNQGPASGTLDIDVNGYADLLGNWLRAIVGPDTVSAGVSTSLAANCSAGATSLSLTAAVPSNSVIQIVDSGGANLEWVKVGSVTGSGPYTAPVSVPAAGARYAHTAAGGSVLSQTTHTFKQNRNFGTVWPTYSFTSDDGADQLGWAGCVESELAIKIDPKGFITCAPKFIGFPSQAESTFAYAASAVQPVVGWAWTVTNAAATSTRGLTMDFTLKRATEVVQASTGGQGPREVFAGAMEADGAYKAVFENDQDISLFKSYTQLPTVHTLTQPVTSGGAVLAITMSQSGYTTGEKDLGSSYMQLSQSLSGIANSSDGGVSQVQLANFVNSAY
jgi:hypothetical protein